jgi:hypothetical protein
MKNHLFTKTSLCLLLCLLMAGGCCINIGSCALRAEHRRTVHLSEPLSPGSGFETQTHNGYIIITGADVTDCNITAEIIARAMTDEDAMELAEQTNVVFERGMNKLTAKIDKPTNMFNRSVGANLKITVPNKTNLELTTHNGRVEITNITGNLDGTTHNGKMIVENVLGDIELYTHNGHISCREISGSTKLKTHNGGIDVYYSENAPPVCDISMITHNGGIELKSPPNFSAEVNASTHNGSINTDLPITVKGKVSKRRLTGTIGAGEGKLHLETHNGSIRIR